MGERLLLVIEIDGSDALAGLDQGDGDMHGNCRLAGAALIIPYDNYTSACHAIPYRSLELKLNEIEFGKGESR
jgi:hypothetical protein